MANYKTRGIVIKRTNFSESDRLLVIFSEKFGKIRAIAKGVRKPLSKLSGNIELFCLTDFVIAEGRNLDIVTSAEIEKCFINLRNHLESTTMAYYFADIIDQMTGENESHQKIFSLLIEVLENIDEKQTQILLPYFEINFLSAIGYKPELSTCVECEKKITEDSYFSYGGGGLVCEACHGNTKISSNAIKVLRIITTSNLSKAKRIKIEPQLLIELKNLSRNYIQHIHQKEFKSRRFIK